MANGDWGFSPRRWLTLRWRARSCVVDFKTDVTGVGRGWCTSGASGRCHKWHGSGGLGALLQRADALVEEWQQPRSALEHGDLAQLGRGRHEEETWRAIRTATRCGRCHASSSHGRDIGRTG
jgi:hypothetical protein